MQDQPDTAQNKQAGHSKTKYPALSGYGPPESSRDPIIILREIIADKDIDENGRNWLLAYSVTRFKNRRRMAYLALGAILVSLALLFLFAILDGQNPCLEENKCTSILMSLSKVQGLLSWIEGFLASIVAAYYGMSSFRPSS